MSEGVGSERVVAGRYRLLTELGRGGMGVVWRARDEVLGRDVAVKEVRPPASLDDHEVQRLYARLEREGWAAARISHRNVVTVYDVATDGGRPWIVMELVRGLSFADVLDAEGPLPPARAAAVGGEVLTALRAAHASGVLHRDVKPGNVLIANDGRVVLSDFGIALVEGGSALTMTGELVGSPEFLAPERALGRTPGPESDLWSLGVLLYAAVEGHTPFRQDTPLSTLRAVVDEELPPPRRAGPLGPVLEGLLRKDPALRLGAAQTERMLRIAAAGGDPRSVSTPVRAAGGAPTAPNRPAVPESDTPHGPGSASRSESSGPPPGTSPPPASADSPGRRRRGLTVAAGMLVAALIASGTTWALLDGRGGKGGGGSGGGGGTSTTGGNGGATKASQGRTGGDGGDEQASGGAGASDTPTSASPTAGSGSPPVFTITVTVTAVRDGYTGSCPAPAAQAPHFTAVITVDRTPVDVEYRWRTGSGESSDGAWKKAEFARGAPRTRTVEHTELTYEAGETYEDWIAVEVRSPRHTASERVPFTVTCEEAPGEASSEATAASQAAWSKTGR